MNKHRDLTGRYTNSPILNKLLFAILVVLIILTAWTWFYVKYVEPYTSPIFYNKEDYTPKIDLSPVTFTPAELEAIDARLQASLKQNWTVERHIREVFGKDVRWALRCLESENYWKDPKAVNYNRNGTVDRGVFQVNSIHCGKVKGDCEAGLFDVETNVKVAKRIFDSSGTRAWFGGTCN